MIKSTRESKKIDKKISMVLKKLGISPSREGYYYIKDSILICLDNELYNLNITKDIYYVLSKKYQKNISAIEKAIRKSIEIGWNNCNLSFSEEVFENIVNYDKAKPTNKEFIITIAEDISLDL